MFQDYALFPHMNVVQNIEAGMGKRPDRSRTESLIRQFQLEGLEKKIRDSFPADRNSASRWHGCSQQSRS